MPFFKYKFAITFSSIKKKKRTRTNYVAADPTQCYENTKKKH